MRRIQTTARLLLVLAASLTLICGFSISRSTETVTYAHDDPSPSPTPDEEKDRLQRAADLAKLKQDKAEADQKTAEARKAELEAKFPKPSTSPLEGKTTIEGAVIESQMISYVSLAKAADRIFVAIRPELVGGGSLAIYNEQDINLMLSYQLANSQITELVNEGYCKILTPAATNKLCPGPSPSPSPSPGPTIEAAPGGAAAVLPIAQSFLGAFVDMTGLLRTNVDIKGQTFTIDEAPLAAEIFRSARGELAISKPTANSKPTPSPQPRISKLILYYPYVFAPNVHTNRDSEILKRLEEVHKVHGNALQIIDSIEKDSKQIEKAEGDIKELNNAIGVELPKANREAITLAGIVIQANCRRLSSEVEFNKTLPEAQRGPDMVRLIDKANRICPRMDVDKGAQMLGLKSTIIEIASDLGDANTELRDVKNKKKAAEDDLRDQLGKLKLDIKPSPTPAQLKVLKDDATAAIAQLKAVNAQFDRLVTSLIEPQAGSLNPLTNYIRTERLASALLTEDPQKSFWLLVKVINAG